MVNDIIPTFQESEHKELKKAANQWRWPFWDWATKKKQTPTDQPNYNVPKIIRPPQVEVRTPDGSAMVRNPFHGFEMPEGVAMGDPKLKQDIVTRDPVSHPQIISCIAERNKD